MKKKIRESESVLEGEGSVPILAEGIGTRIGIVSDRYKTRTEAAKAARVTPDSLYRWIRGEGNPSFEAMAGLAGPVGISLDWLAFDRGPMTLKELEGQRFDVETLEQAVTVLETRLKATNGTMNVEAKAKFTADIYQLLIDEGGDEKSRAKLILSLLSQGL